MNTAVRPPPPSPTELALEAAFLAVALRLQLTPTQHQACEDRYRTLAAWVDRKGSPLEGRVREAYPSGSFAIRAVILASVLRDSHDFDAVLEIDVGTKADPKRVLDALHEAIRGERGSRYYGMTRRNSRCISVTYRDGVTLDLMPVARDPAEPPRAAVLFHHRPTELGRAEERYRKPVNPWGFATFFNKRVPVDPAFATRVRRLREALSTRPLPTELPGMADRAKTQAVPPAVPLEEKPSRVMALQLIKRYRDKRYRDERYRRDDHRLMKVRGRVLTHGPEPATARVGVLVGTGASPRRRERVEQPLAQLGGPQVDGLELEPVAPLEARVEAIEGDLEIAPTRSRAPNRPAPSGIRTPRPRRTR